MEKQPFSLLSLIRYLKPYWHWVLLAPFAMFLEAYMDLLQPALMKRIVDDGVMASDQALVFRTGLQMFCYALLGACGGCLCTYFSSKAAMGFGNDVRKALFFRIQQLAFEQTDRFTAGSLTVRLTSDIGTLQFLVISLTRMLLRSPFLLFGSIVFVVRTDWHLALPLLLSAPLLIIAVVCWMRKLIPLFQKRLEQSDSLNAKMQETLIGIRVVKAFDTEKGEASRFEVLNRALSDTDLKSGYLHSTLGPALSLIQHLTVVVILIVAAYEANSGLVKAGEIAAIVNWVSQVMMSLIHLSFMTMHFSRAVISAHRVLEVLETEPAIRDGEEKNAPEDGSVEFRDVTFAYPGSSGLPVLEHISFKAPMGTHIAIVGATGSGKTTLLNLLARFYEPDSGEILVGGRSIRTYALDSLRSIMGIVLQNPRLFAGTVFENVRWGRPDASNEEVEDVLRIAQADRFVSRFPQRGATNVAQGGVSLSGGQKQRLSIARALIREPKILIFDDATSAVDPVTERLIWDSIRARFRRTTVLSVAQRASSLQAADRILVLEKGRIVGFDTHDELLKNCEIYKEIIDSQITPTDRKEGV